MLNFPVIIKTVIDRMSQCHAGVKSWMAPHNLLLSESKTDVIVISAVRNHKHVQPPVDTYSFDDNRTEPSGDKIYIINAMRAQYMWQSVANRCDKTSRDGVAGSQPRLCSGEYVIYFWETLKQCNAISKRICAGECFPWPVYIILN